MSGGVSVFEDLGLQGSEGYKVLRFLDLGSLIWERFNQSDS